MAPAQVSEAAKAKARSKRTADGQPVHSFRSLLGDLVTIVKNRVVPQVPGADPIEVLTQPTALQREASDCSACISNVPGSDTPYLSICPENQRVRRATLWNFSLAACEIDVVADRGYYKIEDIEACEAAGITPYVPKPDRSTAKRGGHFPKSEFQYDAPTETYRCPAGERLARIFWLTSTSLLAEAAVCGSHVPKTPAGASCASRTNQ